MSASILGSFLLPTKPLDFRGHPGKIPSRGDFLLRDVLLMEETSAPFKRFQLSLTGLLRGSHH